MKTRVFEKFRFNKKLIIKFLMVSFILIYLKVMIHSSIEKNKPIENIKEQVSNCDDFNKSQSYQKLSYYLRPDGNTAIIVPQVTWELVNRRHIASFVLSSPNRKESRQIIRKTWGSILHPLFVIGIDQNNTQIIDEIKVEAEEYDDIIMEDFIDSYDNLTLKTGFAMKHFIKYFSESTYFMKIDDDVNLNLRKLYENLNESPENSLIGFITKNSPPVRDINDKWFISTCEYNRKTYPNYLQGPLYLIPGQFIDPIFQQANQMNSFKIEDVFYTGMIANEKLKLQLHQAKEFWFETLFFWNRFPCVISKFTAFHKTTSDMILKSWTAEVEDDCSFVSTLFVKYLSLIFL
jgi:hypothetical protein